MKEKKSLIIIIAAIIVIIGISFIGIKITDSNSNNFIKYIESMKGNAYVGDNAIGLGCLKDNVISYNNASDEFGNKGTSYKLSSNVSEKIIKSSSSNLIKLELVKYKLTNGSGGYNCTSLITRINVVN